MRGRPPWPEVTKLACLGAIIPLVVVAEQVPLSATLCLSLAHLGGLASAGVCLLRLNRLRVPASPADALVVCYVLGWSTLGLFGLVASARGRIGVEVLVVLALGLGLAALRRPPPSEAESASPVIPWGVYLLALGYVALSVVVPFSFFSSTNLVREFYGDGVQRFAVITALADHVPPVNPFMSGMPLRYYWLGMLPYAAEYRYVWADLFAVWKCGQTWTAMLFVPGLWFIVRALCKRSSVAWWTVLFALVFASWEALLHPALREGIATLTQDPDMLLGIVQRYSDQLLVEDFLYIPHNAWALMMVLGSVWLLAEGRLWGALPGLTAVAAVNTFFIIPAGFGYVVAALGRWPLRPAACACGAFVALAACWLALVGIVPHAGLWGLPIALALGLAAGGHLGPTSPVRHALPAVALALLAALAALLLLDLRHHPLAYLLNYGPAVVAGVYILFLLVRRRHAALPETMQTALLFLLAASAVVLGLTAFLLLADASWAPPAVRAVALRAGEVLNSFNFYHKTAKLVRLTWSMLGALAVATITLRTSGGRPWRRALVWGAGLCLLLSTVTTLWRPLTYATSCGVPEAAAARYLIAHDARPERVVLAENYRGTQINMLAPVSVYCYSQWGNGNLGLSTREGTWLDQYLPAALRPQSRSRELAVEHFFSPAATEVERAALLRTAGVDYILTRQPWTAGALAHEVVAIPGGYLYQVER